MTFTLPRGRRNRWRCFFFEKSIDRIATRAMAIVDGRLRNYLGGFAAGGRKRAGTPGPTSGSA